MAKFTKGEWKVRDYQTEDGEYDVCTIDGGLDAMIARVGGVTALKDAQANAHLIAAAPEMYQKLVKIRTWLTRLAEHDEVKAKTEQFLTLRDAYITDAKNYRATVADIDKALAKTEGR